MRRRNILIEGVIIWGKIKSWMGQVWLYSHRGKCRNQSLRTFRGKEGQQLGRTEAENAATSTREEGGSQEVK